MALADLRSFLIILVIAYHAVIVFHLYDKLPTASLTYPTGLCVCVCVKLLLLKVNVLCEHHLLIIF